LAAMPSLLTVPSRTFSWRPDLFGSWNRPVPLGVAPLRSAGTAFLKAMQ
jgi:hypothetical protein